MSTPDESEGPLAQVAADARAARLADAAADARAARLADAAGSHMRHARRLRRLEARAAALTWACAILAGLLVAEAAGAGLLVPRAELAESLGRLAATEVDRERAEQARQRRWQDQLDGVRKDVSYVYQVESEQRQEVVRLSGRVEELKRQVSALQGLANQQK